MNWREEIEKFVIRNDASTTPESRPRLDVKGMISQPELLHAIVAEIGDMVLKKHPKIKAIGSHGVGGSFLISPIILYVYDHWFNVNGFFVRLDAEYNATHNPIEGRLERGWRVVIVDTMIDDDAGCFLRQRAAQQVTPDRQPAHQQSSTTQPRGSTAPMKNAPRWAWLAA